MQHTELNFIKMGHACFKEEKKIMNNYICRPDINDKTKLFDPQTFGRKKKTRKFPPFLRRSKYNTHKKRKR